MPEKVSELSVFFEAKPTATFEPDAGSFYESWIHYHGNVDSGPYHPVNTPEITIDPKYQGIYDYWVQRRKETPKPITLVEQIEQIRQDQSNSSLITQIAFALIIVGAALLLLARKIMDKQEHERSLMTERSEGVIKAIKRKKSKEYKYGVVCFEYRGQIYEKEFLLPIDFEEGRRVGVLFDPNNFNRSMIDIPNAQERNPYRIAAWVLFLIGIVLLVWIGF